MTPAEAQKIFDDIMVATKDADDLMQWKRDFLEIAIRYARLRTDWRMTDLESRQQMDKQRKLAHNALIDSCNILSRACGTAGRSNEWRRALGEDRKEMGDFACHLHAILGVQAR